MKIVPSLTDEQVNKLANEAALSQYRTDTHAEYESTVNGYIMGYNEAISQMQPKWIPVTESMPEVGEFVLVYRIEGYYSVDQYRQLHGDVKSFVYNVTHWMPLPEPPNH